ncbi:hypothetical protein Tco_0571182 [Tanacetum coccineum]
MTSTRASISKASKRLKINIIPPKQLFVDLTQDDTKTPSPKHQLSPPSSPNAPSKTPSTKDTSSSSIKYIPKSPTSSTSLSPNGYLNPPTSPPPRVPLPPPIQAPNSMEITLSLSPITLLDVHYNSPSVSPPIIGNPIPWNLLEAHGDSCLCFAYRIYMRGVPLLLAFACSRFGALVMSVIEMLLAGLFPNHEEGERVGRGGRVRGPRGGNDERVNELNGQGNKQGLGANGGVEGVNRNVEGVNRGIGGAPDFLTIIAQQLQNFLPAMLAQVGNQVNVGNQNGNVVNENVQENVGNVIVNGNRVGCSYKEFLACNPKEYDGKGGAVVLTRWIDKMEPVQDMIGCSIDQKVKYTTNSFLGDPGQIPLGRGILFGIGMGFEIVASDVREDDEEFEAEASLADTRETVVDPLAIGDSFETSRGASQLVASGKRASLVERIRSLRLEYLKVRAMLSIERDRIDSLRWHMALSQEEFRQVRRDRDDTRRRLRRLESYVERHLGFRP